MEIRIENPKVRDELLSIVDRSDFKSTDELVEELLKIFIVENIEDSADDIGGTVDDREVRSQLDALGYLNDE